MAGHIQNIGKADASLKRRRSVLTQPATRHGRFEVGRAPTRRRLSPITAPLDQELEAQLQAEGLETFLRPLPGAMCPERL